MVDENGNIEMRYHQANTKGELMMGVYFSKPEILANGKIRLLETWQSTSGAESRGTSILEESVITIQLQPIQQKPNFMVVNKLKSLITIFIVIVSFNLKSQFVKETCATEVQVIGFDASKCGACWGFMITFDDTPEGEYLLPIRTSISKRWELF